MENVRSTKRPHRFGVNWSAQPGTSLVNGSLRYSLLRAEAYTTVTGNVAFEWISRCRSKNRGLRLTISTLEHGCGTALTDIRIKNYVSANPLRTYSYFLSFHLTSWVCDCSVFTSAHAEVSLDDDQRNFKDRSATLGYQVTHGFIINNDDQS